MARYKPSLLSLPLIMLVVLLTACAGAGGSDVAGNQTEASNRVASIATALASRSASLAPTRPSRITSSPNTTTAAISTTTASDLWAQLQQRPLNLPTALPATVCPATPYQLASQLISGAGFGPSYLAFGSGPIYPIIYNADPKSGVLPFGILSQDDGASKQDKVLWVASPIYKGEGLIRGRQLNGGAKIGFRFNGTLLPGELRYPLNTGIGSADTPLGWRDLPSEMVLPGPGCYAFQVDGTSFSTAIVFKAAA
jgi:hypothetical protein